MAFDAKGVRRRCALPVLLLALSSCSQRNPAAPQPQPNAMPPVRLFAGINYGTAAIESVSTVVFSAEEVAGCDCSYMIDFGDGQQDVMWPGFYPHTTVREAYHTYSRSGLGAPIARMTVTNERGDRAMASVNVVVRNLTGVWTTSGGGPVVKLVQQAATLTGSYTGPEGRDVPLTGRLSSPRSIQFVVGNGLISFYGTDLDGAGVNADVTGFAVLFTSGAERGRKLTFVAAP